MRPRFVARRAQTVNLRRTSAAKRAFEGYDAPQERAPPATGERRRRGAYGRPEPEEGP
jgi:hypothetical protein